MFTVADNTNKGYKRNTGGGDSRILRWGGIKGAITHTEGSIMICFESLSDRGGGTGVANQLSTDSSAPVTPPLCTSLNTGL